MLSDLSIGLRAIVSPAARPQRRRRRCSPAVEILLNTSLIAELIKNGEITQIKEAMEQSLYPGSQTFEQALCRLYLDEQISYDEAMIASDSPTNLAWLINQNSPTRTRRRAMAQPRRNGKAPRRHARLRVSMTIDPDMLERDRLAHGFDAGLLPSAHGRSRAAGHARR